MKRRYVSVTGALCVLVLAVTVQAKTFKVAIGDGLGGTQAHLGQTFADLLTEKLGPKYKVTLFPNGQLGSEQDTVSDAQMGTLDFSILAVNNLTPFSPKVGILTLPYVILSNEDAKKMTSGGIGEELVDATLNDAGVRIIGWAYSGFRRLTNSNRPVKTLADLNGLIIRVPKNEIMIDCYKAWGINPTPMAWSETFTALQQKVVDGQDNPYMTIYAMKFNEVQKYITTTRYIFSLEPLIVSEQVFQGMSKKEQQAVLEAGREATEDSFKFLATEEDKIKKDLQKKGMEISAPADDEKEWIEKATTTVWPKYYKSIGGKEKFDAILKTLGRDVK